VNWWSYVMLFVAVRFLRHHVVGNGKSLQSVALVVAVQGRLTARCCLPVSVLWLTQRVSSSSSWHDTRPHNVRDSLGDAMRSARWSPTLPVFITFTTNANDTQCWLVSCASVVQFGTTFFWERFSVANRTMLLYFHAGFWSRFSATGCWCWMLIRGMCVSDIMLYVCGLEKCAMDVM